MPAILEDPHTPHHVAPLLPGIPSATLQPRTVILQDHVTVATIIPILSSAQSIPVGLLSFLHDEFNREIERGDTYPMDQPLTLEGYSNYWFGTFAAVMLLGNETTLQEGRDWATECLGTFYIKPNYPGRCNHICNAGFLVCHGARGKGVGKLLGEAYLDYAPKLNYTYSVFNLVFESNTASTKIWESLGFKRIGLVKGAGRLKGHAAPVDAIIYGRELGEDEDYVSEERFDKIRFYLEKGKYPPNADRSEKSRLRSATTHYRLDGNKLLLKDKEVISDGHEQYEIAKRIHRINHGGINKTTAQIADKYHWVRIKETVSAVIKNCQECKETARAPVVRGDRTSNSPRPSGAPHQLTPQPQQPPTNTSPPMMQQFDLSALQPPQMVPSNLQSQSLQSHLIQSQIQQSHIQQTQHMQPQLQSSLPPQLQSPLQSQLGGHPQSQGMPHPTQMSMGVNLGVDTRDMDIPVDPAMMEDVTTHLTHSHHHQQHHQQFHSQVQQHQQHQQQHPSHPHQVHQQHHLQHTQHIAPVAQMHAGASRLMVGGGTDGSELQQQLENHHASSAHSAEIARAALTEEDRAMRDQLVEGLRGIGDASGVGVDGGMDVGVGVVGGGLGQDMELDEQSLYAAHAHGGHDLGESKDHV